MYSLFIGSFPSGKYLYFPRILAIGMTLLFLFSLDQSAQAQQVDFFGTHEIQKKKKKKKDLKTPDTLQQRPSKSWALGFSAGTHAFFGSDIAINLSPHFNLRLAYQNLSYSLKESTIDVGEEELLFQADLNQNHWSIWADYAFAKQKIRLSTGLAYYTINEINGQGILSDSLAIEDIRISPDEIGFVKGEVSFKNSISPYLGIGFGRTVPQKAIGFNLDFGAYYRSSPQVNLEATNLLRNNVNNEQAIEDAISFVQWWPVISFRLAIKLK